MVSTPAQKKLTKEYRSIQASPPQYIVAKPSDANILEWHYVITGPPKTPYEDGQYHGILRFPKEYPFLPPSIIMITPLGRFQCNTRLCLLISDYHPDTWNPTWSVLTILVGLLSFMTGDETTMGSITTSDYTKIQLAQASKAWNCSENVRFRQQFPELYQQNLLYVKQKKLDEDTAAAVKAAAVAAKSVKSDANSGTINLDELDLEDRIRILLENEIKGRDNGGINNREQNDGLLKLVQRFSMLGVFVAVVAAFANYFRS
ncbi:Ubiquitin-conjugating enzyme E2 6 [Scheffersomyces spartinae]|uniref:Ubiquitin-conjugating enzyme E2 6 n=1 Tax=Scheffersomyces spartinae TaxID=45513 RepID=A0A9P8AHQ9_9ASCO|nr:Ubiquitin-conjugating enzyme E2 6 [Scheffersomyces spartinae]KAG7193032.1 Ubiquitin-conjugating enzyme E2 6 [Scheffersomyces spartinae]